MAEQVPPEQQSPSLMTAPDPESGRKRRRLLSWLCLVAILCVVFVTVYYYCYPREIRSTGGVYFISSLRLNVSRFAQGDPRWGSQFLGPSSSTMAGQGCAVASAAMVLNFYGDEIDPGKLNAFLGAHSGYTPQGWLYWEIAADFQPGKVQKAYEDLPSYFLIDSNLLRGNPVIVRIRFPNGITHFVVVVGKQGFSYLIQDPASGGNAGVYPLENLASKIEALRFYKRLK
jgi:hypothetical protein